MPARTLAFLGSFVNDGRPGITVCDLDRATGKLAPRSVAPVVANPSYLALSSDGRRVYCVCDIPPGGAGQPAIPSVAAFAFDPFTYGWTRLNDQPAHGTSPCHLSLDATGRALLVANYSSGSVASYPLMKDGSIGPAGSAIQHHGKSINPSRQEGPHAHSIYADPSNRFALAVDLGLDQVLTYRLEPATGKLTPAPTPFSPIAPGAGPRHLAFSPNGKWAYVINELNDSLGAYAYDPATGSLVHLHTLPTLPAGWKGTNYPSDVAVSPDGRFVFGSNRGHESIAIFAIDDATGRMTVVGHEPVQGKFPRAFGISPRGDFLLVANQHTHNVVSFRIDAATGKLTPTGQSLETLSPCCVKFFETAE